MGRKSTHVPDVTAEDYLDAALVERLAENAFNLSTLQQPTLQTRIGDVVFVEVTGQLLDDSGQYIEARVLSDDESVNGILGRFPAWQNPDSRPGTTLECVVVSDADVNGQVELCHLPSGRWSVATQAFAEGCYLAATVTQIATRKDGREVGVVANAIGFRAFIPRSEINQHISLASLIGKTLPVRIQKLVEPKPGKAGELVVSYNAALLAQQNRYIAQLQLVRRFRPGETLPFMDTSDESPATCIDTMPGIEMRGRVRKTIEAGTLVDLNHNLTGLVPPRELTRGAGGRPLAPDEGSEVIVEVINVDPIKRHVLLSIRGPEERRFYADLREGKIMTGIVTVVKPFGVFVKLGPVTGLLHQSEFKETDGQREAAPEEGDQVTVMVLSIQQQGEDRGPRISLTRKFFGVAGMFDEPAE